MEEVLLETSKRYIATVKIKKEVVSFASMHVIQKKVPAFHYITPLELSEMPEHFKGFECIIDDVWTKEEYRKKGYATRCLKYLYDKYRMMSRETDKPYQLSFSCSPDLKEFFENIFTKVDENNKIVYLPKEVNEIKLKFTTHDTVNRRPQFA